MAKRKATVSSGTRIFSGPQALFDSLESGEMLKELLEGFPSVTREMAIAALERAKEFLSSPLVTDR
jgi:uncharacterized protein (DUF433 family)